MPRPKDAIDRRGRPVSLHARSNAGIDGRRVAAAFKTLHAFDKYSELKTTWIDLA